MSVNDFEFPNFKNQVDKHRMPASTLPGEAFSRAYADRAAARVKLHSALLDIAEDYNRVVEESGECGTTMMRRLIEAEKAAEEAFEWADNHYYAVAKQTGVPPLG